MAYTAICWSYAWTALTRHLAKSQALCFMCGSSERRFAYVSRRNSKPKLISPLTIAFEAELRFNPAPFVCVRDQTNTNKRLWLSLEAWMISVSCQGNCIYVDFEFSFFILRLCLSVLRLYEFMNSNQMNATLELFMKLCKESRSHLVMILKPFLTTNASGRPFGFWLEMTNAITKIMRCTNKERKSKKKKVWIDRKKVERPNVTNKCNVTRITNDSDENYTAHSSLWFQYICKLHKVSAQFSF